MSKLLIQTDQSPAPGGAYSQGLRVGNFVFVSGQGPLNPRTGSIIGESIEEQTANTLNNIQAILVAAGVELQHVVKATVHLSDLSLFDRFNQVYASYFSDPKPTRTTVGSQLPGILIEIDVIAYLE